MADIDYKDYGGILLDSVTSMVTNMLFDFIGRDTEDFSAVDYEAAEAEIMKNFHTLLGVVHEKNCPW